MKNSYMTRIGHKLSIRQIYRSSDLGFLGEILWYDHEERFIEAALIQLLRMHEFISVFNRAPHDATFRRKLECMFIVIFKLSELNRIDQAKHIITNITNPYLLRVIALNINHVKLRKVPMDRMTRQRLKNGTHKIAWEIQEFAVRQINNEKILKDIVLSILFRKIYLNAVKRIQEENPNEVHGAISTRALIKLFADHVPDDTSMELKSVAIAAISRIQDNEWLKKLYANKLLSTSVRLASLYNITDLDWLKRLKPKGTSFTYGFLIHIKYEEYHKWLIYDTERGQYEASLKYIADEKFLLSFVKWVVMTEKLPMRAAIWATSKISNPEILKQIGGLARLLGIEELYAQSQEPNIQFEYHYTWY